MLPLGATSDMIGITASQFKTNEMNFSLDKLTILFMIGYERPSYDPDVNHIATRIQFAINWYYYITGQLPYYKLKRNGRRIILWKNKL